MKISILSLFPDYFTTPFQTSILGRAIHRELLSINLVNIRDFSQGKYRQVDDRPYGGGPGMVMMAEPVVRAIGSVKTQSSHTIYLSPQGNLFSASKAEALSKKKELILLSGHYEGVDQRVIDHYVDEELSIGNYVLTNGCLAALVVLDAIVRFIPSVLGNEQSFREDSFQRSLFDYPHYTRPRCFQGISVPEVLLNGNHREIERWRFMQAKEKTERVLKKKREE